MTGLCREAPELVGVSCKKTGECREICHNLSNTDDKNALILIVQLVYNVNVNRNHVMQGCFSVCNLCFFRRKIYGKVKRGDC